MGILIRIILLIFLLWEFSFVLLHKSSQVNRVCQFLERFYEREAESKRDKVLIFAETKRTADFLDRLLYRRGFRVAATHGDKSQAQREAVLRDFRSGRTPVLVATNVAARGLDVDDVKCVVNYDFPSDSEDYIHRIGRTGRRDRAGTSFTLFTAEDARSAEDLISILREANQLVPPELEELAMHAPTRGGKKKNFRDRGSPFRSPRGSSYGRRDFGRSRYDFGGSRYRDDGGYGGRGRYRGDQDEDYDFRSRRASSSRRDLDF